MAAEEPPTNVPRIADVQNPATGHYVVMVRMPTQLAAKYPDKPWGTAIESIGLARGESAKYPGYVLVDVEPLKGSPDMFWIFQKLDGPAWTTTSNSRDNLTPPKYRGQTVVVKTEQEVDPGTAPTALAGDLVSSVVAQTPNTGKAVLSEVTETIAENTAPLEGEEYGEIVTKSVSEVLVDDGTTADAGINVISSVVEPIGNGKSVKQTKTAKGGWPDPINKEVSKEGADMPPPRYRKDLTRTKTTRKIAASAVPSTPSLSGNEVAKTYQKETPDRAEESVVTQSFTLNTSSVDEAVEQKPFVKITSKMTPGTAPVVPASGNGSAKLVYEAPNGSKIYENTAETAVARPGPSGEEKDTKPFVTIKTAKRFSTTADISTLTGSANVVFNDGATQIYEVSEVTSTGRFGAAGVEQQTKPFVSITSTATYQNTGTLGAGEVGSTNKIYDDGATTVYEKKVDTATARSGPAGTEKDEKPFVKIETKKRYSSTSDVATKTGSANIVFNDGKVQVYEVSEVTSTAKTGPAGEEQQTKPFVSITSTKTYASDGNLGAGEVGSTNKIYDDGSAVVYEKSVETAVARSGPAGTEKDEKPFVRIETKKRYSPNADVATKTGSANVVFNDGKVQVYEVNEVTSTAKLGPAGAEQQTKPFVSITSTKTYASDGNLGAGEVGSTNKIYDDGSAIVYEKSVDTAVARPGPAGTEKDEKPFVRIETKKRYSPDADVATKTGSSNIVFNDGKVQVYEVSEVTSTAKPGLKGIETNAQQWGSIKSTTDYTTSSNAPSGGSVNLVYNDGQTTVYESTTTTATTSGTGKDVDSQQWGKVEWNGTYAKTTSGTRSRQVWSNGVEQVFFNETPTVMVSGSNKDVDANAWGTITWDGTYATSSGGQKSRQVARVGDTSVFLNETATLNPQGVTKEVDANSWGRITWSGTYGVVSSGDKSRQVYSGPGGSVYLNETALINPQGVTKDVDAKEWGSITWSGTYSSSPSGSQNDRSRQVYSGPGGSVYLNETPTVTPLAGSFASAKKTTPTYKITETTSFSNSSEAGEPNSQSRLVFAQGTHRVFEKTVRKVEEAGKKIYYSVINAQTPSVLKQILTEPIRRKPNSEGPRRDKICVRADIEEGYSGLFPAKITEYFTKNTAAAETFKPLVFKTKRIDYDGIQYQVSIGETLHNQINLVDAIGTNDPDYQSLQYLPSTFTSFLATEPPSVPTGWQNYAIQIDPFEDGYLVKEIQVKYKD